jgi:uncharacterized protein YlaI
VTMLAPTLRALAAAGDVARAAIEAARQDPCCGCRRRKRKGSRALLCQDCRRRLPSQVRDRIDQTGGFSLCPIEFSAALADAVEFLGHGIQRGKERRAS